MPLPRRAWPALFIAAVLVAFGLGSLLTGLADRQQEAARPRALVTPIGDQERDPSVWGLNFPQEYRSWRRPSPALSRAAEGGELFAGYSFARDYHRGRSGHPEGLHPAACLDCHDPRTMRLRISQPAFAEALTRRGIDPARTPEQALRTYVCAQCHSTYTFRRDETLDFPHERGLKSEELIQALEARGITDWTHASSATPMLKLRGPAYELWSRGIHADRGVACTDCTCPMSWKRAAGSPATRSTAPCATPWRGSAPPATAGLRES